MSENVSSKIEQLFNTAAEALENLVRNIEGVGGMAPGHFIATTAEDLKRDRYIEMWWQGRLIDVPVSDIDLFIADKVAFLARYYGITEQVSSEFIEHILDSPDLIVNYKHERGRGVARGVIHIECNYPECRMKEYIYFSTPEEMLSAKRRSNNEIWYCHHHWQPAFEQEGALADYMVQYLYKIGQEPGILMKDIGGNRKELDFLQEIGLIKISKRLLKNNVTRAHYHYLTEDGVKVVNKMNAIAESAVE